MKAMAVLNDIKVLLGKKKPYETPKHTHPQKKVLIVEDESVLQEMYKDKFTTEGFSVFVANDGQHGLKQAVEHKPDIILLDLMMPIMDGKTMLRKLRELPDFKKLPVIILTNAGEVENIMETQHFDNACEFLIKSNVSVDEIVKKVKFWL
jgi:DNA-binding response OmpR family regulator